MCPPAALTMATLHFSQQGFPPPPSIMFSPCTTRSVPSRTTCTNVLASLALGCFAIADAEAEEDEVARSLGAAESSTSSEFCLWNRLRPLRESVTSWPSEKRRKKEPPISEEVVLGRAPPKVLLGIPPCPLRAAPWSSSCSWEQIRMLNPYGFAVSICF